MKLAIPFVAALFTMQYSMAGNAASSATLNVGGSVAPSPCTVVIAGGNEFKYGTLKSDDLHPTEENHYIQSKTISIVCPAPTGIWVAFPFNNGGQLQPHGSNVATGQLAWWYPHRDGPGQDACSPDMPEDERVKVDTGDGLLSDSVEYARVRNGRVIINYCKVGAYFHPGPEILNGAEDGFYIAHSAAKTLQVPRFLRMTVKPRDELDTSGAIQLRGGAVVVVNYI